MPREGQSSITISGEDEKEIRQLYKQYLGICKIKGFAKTSFPTFMIHFAKRGYYEWLSDNNNS